GRSAAAAGSDPQRRAIGARPGPPDRTLRSRAHPPRRRARLSLRHRAARTRRDADGNAAMSRLPQTPSHTVGPFFSIGLCRDGSPGPALVGGGGRGERIRIEGTVVDGAGAPVDDAMIEIWQADADGSYRSADPDVTGYGRAATDVNGAFAFDTIRPGPVAGAAGAAQAPHVNVIVFARGMLVHAFTRMYFSDEPGNAGDAVLQSVDPGR